MWNAFKKQSCPKCRLRQFLAPTVLNFTVRRSWWHGFMPVPKSLAIQPMCQISPYGRDGLYFWSRWQVKEYSDLFSDVSTGDDFYHLIHARTNFLTQFLREFITYILYVYIYVYISIMIFKWRSPLFFNFLNSI